MRKSGGRRAAEYRTSSQVGVPNSSGTHPTPWIRDSYDTGLIIEVTIGLPLVLDH